MTGLPAARWSRASICISWLGFASFDVYANSGSIGSNGLVVDGSAHTAMDLIQAGILACLVLLCGVVCWQYAQNSKLRRCAADLASRVDRQQRTLQLLPDALAVVDLDTHRFVDGNEGALRILGVRHDELSEVDPREACLPVKFGQLDEADPSRDHIRRALDGEVVRFEWTGQDRNGNEILADVRLVALVNERQRLLLITIADIAYYHDARNASLAKSAQLEATIENTDQGVVMVDAQLNTVTYNQRFLEMLNLSPDQIWPGRPYEKIIRICAERGDFGPGDINAIVAGRIALLARFEALTDVRTRSTGRVLELRRRPIPGGGAVTTYTDVTETHLLSEELAFQARHDSLTSLANRRRFEEQLEKLIGTCRDGHTEHAICYLDLDQFKVINDTCGHAAGDELLRQLATALQTNIRKSDLLARLGGDEFGTLLENCNLHEAQRIANAMRSCVEEFRFVWLDRSFRVGVSVGLVPVTYNSGTVADVLSAADAACYAAKDQGRNRVHVYAVDDAALSQRHVEMSWVTKLQEALENDRMCLLAQTIMPIASGTENGEHYELLVRMQSEDGQMISPGLFLPAAERYNLIGRLDRWVVQRAFQTLAADADGLRGLYACSINLSGDSLSDTAFLQYVIEQFECTGIPPEKIVFEVTETAAISHLTRAVAFMEALRKIGCRFSLDDFGSGLSSFGYLKTLPVDYVKIDGMFVKEMLENPIDLAMVKCINEIGQLMGKHTVAEFVEDDAILARLRELGIDYAQGYGVGRPKPFAVPATSSSSVALHNVPGERVA